MKRKDAKVSTSEAKALRDFLKANGMLDSQATTLVKTAKTREENGRDLIGWLKDRPKKK